MAIQLPQPLIIGEAIIDRLEIRQYPNRKTAIQLLCDDGEMWATLSVNVPDDASKLGPDEFFLKDYSENSETVRLMLDKGYIEIVNKPLVHSGFVALNTARLNMKALIA